MAGTLYHHLPVPMGDRSNNLMLWCHRWLKWLLVISVMVVLIVLVIILANRLNSTTCKDVLGAEQECQNITYLEHQLNQAQRVLLETNATCNQTVVTLMDSLKMEQAQGHKQQQLVQKLQEEIKELKQNLQNTSMELERLRKWKETSGREEDSTSSGNTFSLCMVIVLLPLTLEVLLV
uniref:BST-2 n=1 Tax=Miniopterus schreibersii TaxID=9433 RepID=A0A8F2Z0U8_MINSC|nr:BST-2 [Miniopterus schreibersii]